MLQPAARLSAREKNFSERELWGSNCAPNPCVQRNAVAAAYFRCRPPCRFPDCQMRGEVERYGQVGEDWLTGILQQVKQWNAAGNGKKQHAGPILAALSLCDDADIFHGLDQSVA